MQVVDRSVEARAARRPDLFLSHSARDKQVVRRLAEDLSFCQVDAWLDEWELQVGDSLYDVIGHALEQSRFVGVVLGEHFADSRWARDELKQALARERRGESGTVLPLLFGAPSLPPFLEDRLYLDFRADYHAAVARLAAMVHGVSGARIAAALQRVVPRSINDCINTLRYCGIEPYMVVGADDFREILNAGGTVHGDRIRFSPRRVAASDGVSPHIVALMERLEREVWVS
jgi:hypothetical protein